MPFDWESIKAQLGSHLVDPRVRGALTGAAVGAGGLGLLGYLSSNEQNRKRKALLAALMGGAAGGGLGYWMGQPAPNHGSPFPADRASAAQAGAAGMAAAGGPMGLMGDLALPGITQRREMLGNAGRSVSQNDSGGESVGFEGSSLPGGARGDTGPPRETTYGGLGSQPHVPAAVNRPPTNTPGRTRDTGENPAPIYQGPVTDRPAPSLFQRLSGGSQFGLGGGVLGYGAGSVGHHAFEGLSHPQQYRFVSASLPRVAIPRTAPSRLSSALWRAIPAAIGAGTGAGIGYSRTGAQP